MMSLPLVLSGPLLRRAEPAHVAVWIALSHSATVTLTVFQGSQVSTGAGTAGGPVVATGVAATRPFGAQLHIACVTADATTSLFPGSLYSYDVVVDGKGLKDIGLLRDATDDSSRQEGVSSDAPKHLALGYELDRLPGFAMPGATLADTKLIHTSCRKSNGEGPDALAWVDDEIHDHQNDPVQCPQQLFLTGDQIYADDLGSCLLPGLSTLGIELLGFTEHLSISGVDVAASEVNLPTLRRQRLVREVARFTTTDGANHLLTLGEWAAMYVLSFSPHVWRGLATADDVFRNPPTEVDTWHLTHWEQAYGDLTGWRTNVNKKTGETTEKEFAADLARVEAWRDAVPKVARALANVPTYMICDDHEITDDWYISKRWRSRVLTAPLGRQIIRHGLMAYTVFQGWGNEPSAFAPQGGTRPPGDTLLSAIEAYCSDGVPTVQATTDTLDEYLGLTAPNAVPKVSFHYSVPGPRHFVRVLDTRTRRTYDGEGNNPPKLVGDSLDAQFPAGPLADGRQLLLVVSASPVLFPRLFDVLVQPAAAAVFELQHHAFGEDDPTDQRHPGDTIRGTEQWDVEGWHAVETAFETFIRRCGSYSRVLLLSGDVHFASSMVLDFWGKGDETADSRIVQLTSSAARNQPEATMRAALRAMPFGQALLQGAPYDRLGWDAKPPINVPHGSTVRPGRRARLRRTPGIVPASGWPAGTTLDTTKPPDWRWRLTCLRDERPNPPRADSDSAGPLPTVGGDILQSYADIVGYQANAANNAVDPLRLMVFRNNIGVITFTPDGPDEVIVTHEILSPVGAPDVSGDRYTQHTATTTRATTAAPALTTV
jgi:hypothetical protein